MRRARLTGDEWLEVSARNNGEGVEFKLAQVAFCRDDVVVGRGLHVTTQREVSSRTRTAEWVTFGGLVGLTLAVAAAGSSCGPDHDHVCSNMAQAVGLSLAGGALVSGLVLLTDSLRAVDGAEDQQRSSTPERRDQVCERSPKPRVRVDAIVGEMRASAVTDEGGLAVIAVGREPGKTAMTLSVDGVVLGTAVVSREWRTVHLRDRTGSSRGRNPE